MGKYYNKLLIANIVLLLVSDVIVGKLVSVFGITMVASALTIPFLHIISDVTTEVYGYKAAKRMLFYTLCSSIVAGIVYQIAVYLPAAPGFTDSEAFTRVLGQVPRIMIVGWLAIALADLANNYTMVLMKRWTNGRYLWARTIGSSFVGQIVNSLIFFFPALYGIVPTPLIIEAMLTVFIIRMAVEIVVTPVIYPVVNFLMKQEGKV